MANVTGTLKYATGFTGFSGTAAEQEGNFLALNVAVPDGATFAVSGTNKTKVQDNLVVARVTDKTKPITITATKDGQSSTEELDLSGLTLTAKPAPAPTLGTLTVTAAKLADGKAVLTLPNPDSGNSFRYKVTEANAKPTVAYDDVLTMADGWADMPADKAVAGTAGQVVTVVEIAGGAKARKKGEVTLA